jgi:hypothetical protein
MLLLKHAKEQPFILATSLASFVHSTWSLAVLMSGHPPTLEGDAGSVLRGAFWLLPAMAIAFSLDIGQLQTSHDLRHNRKTFAKLLTFAVFSLATYFLQFLYVQAHMPVLALSEGVRAEWVGTVSLIRDASLWVIPGLLPLSTLLYTFSSDNPNQNTTTGAAQADVITQAALGHNQPGLTDDQESSPAQAAHVWLSLDQAPPFIALCPACGWTREYTSPIQSAQGLKGHQIHCAATKEARISANGHGELVS